MNSKSAITILLMVLMMVLAVAGCTHNKTMLNDEGVFAQTDTANLVRLGEGGQIEAKGYGAGPSVVNVDPEGIYSGQAVPLGVLHFSLPNFVDPNGKPMQAHITSPEDVEIASASFTFIPATGEIRIEFTGLKANKSPVIAEQTKALQIALVALDSMAKTEAEASIKKWEVLGTFGGEVIGVLNTFFGLKFPATP